MALLALLTSECRYDRELSRYALIYLALDFIPAYFQAVLGAGPIRSGVDLLPTALVLAPAAIVCDVCIKTFSRYLPPNVIGWMLTLIGFGVPTLLKVGSPVANWVGFQILLSIGLGILVWLK